MSSLLPLATFLIIALGGGLGIGIACPPGEWYTRLRKPAFNPPNWVFAPAWTVLYILIAFAGWRTWQDGESAALVLWALQLALNFTWSPVFFRAHAPRAALGIVLALFLAVVTFVVLQTERDIITALLFVPYAIWVAFAGLLNAAIIRLNREMA